MECAPDSSDGCSRCRIPLPISCCDLCDPALKTFGRISMPATSTKARGTKIKKKYEPTEQDQALRRALDAFREEAVVEEFGEEDAKDLGSSIILCNETLDRIVDCAHWGRVRSPQQLLELTKWDRSNDLGPRIVAIIDQTHPPQRTFPPPRSTSSQSSANHPIPPLSPSKRGNTVAPSAARTVRRVLRCSKCGGEGHMCKFHTAAFARCSTH